MALLTLGGCPDLFLAAWQWNPWVGGGMPYCFAQQPQAAAVNLVGLSEAFVQLVEVRLHRPAVRPSSVRPSEGWLFGRAVHFEGGEAERRAKAGADPGDPIRSQGHLRRYLQHGAR